MESNMSFNFLQIRSSRGMLEYIQETPPYSIYKSLKPTRVSHDLINWIK